MIHLNVVESTYFAAVTDKNIYNGSIGSDEEAISVIRCGIYNVYCIYIFIFVSEEFERGVQEIREIVKRYCCCCCCRHIKSRSGLYSVLSNIRTGPTDADALRGHRLTTQKGYTYQKEIKGPRKVSTHAIIGK